MATIGVIKIASEFNINGIKKGAASAVGALGKFKQSTASVASSVTGLAGVLTAAAGAYGISALVSSSLDAINTTRLLSERLGVTTESLSRLQYAANAAGVDSSTLEGALGKVNSSLIEVAKTGTGPAADALRKFRLNANDLVKAGPVEAFKRMAGALQGIENPAERASTAMALFGSDKIVTLVNRGSEGIAALEAEADALGATLNGLDAAKASEATQSIDRLWAAVGTLGKTLAVELAPFITEAANQFVAFAKMSQQSGGVVSHALGGIGSAGRVVLDVFDALGAGFHHLEGYLLLGIGKIIQGIGKLAGGIDYVVEKLTGLKSGLAESFDFDTYVSAFEESAKQQFGAVEQYLTGPSTKELVTDWVSGIKEAADTRAKAAVAAAPKPGADITKPIEMKLSGAAQLGSKEAVQAAAKFRTGVGLNNDPLKQMAGNTGKANELLTKTVGYLQQIANRRPEDTVKSLVGA